SRSIGLPLELGQRGIKGTLAERNDVADQGMLSVFGNEEPLSALSLRATDLNCDFGEPLCLRRLYVYHFPRHLRIEAKGFMHEGVDLVLTGKIGRLLGWLLRRAGCMG